MSKYDRRLIVFWLVAMALVLGGAYYEELTQPGGFTYTHTPQYRPYDRRFY